MRLTLLCLLAAAVLPARAAEYFLSPAGNDAWSGRLPAPNAAKTDGPFATPARARDQLRKEKGGTVTLRGGTYELPQGFKLAAQDSNTTWRAHPGETATLVGGRRVTSFKPYKGQVLQAQLPADLRPTFHQLIFGGARQPLARYPNFDPQNPYGGGWAYVDGKPIPMYQDVPNEDRRTLVYKPADARAWARPADGEVFVFARYNWWNNIERITAVDPATRTITIAKDASYAMRPGDRYYVQGHFEELDAPGEWYLDREKSVLYFWPPAPLPDVAVTVPTTRTILEVSGATNVTIRNLTFECSEGDAVQLRECRDSAVVGCVIRNVGDYRGSGVAVTGGTNNGVAGCDVSHTGSSGVFIAGGDRTTLTAAGNYADNNYIHHVGVYYKQGVGVTLTGVGNRATHNLIHDGPRMGILFSGNNLLIEFNHVRHVNLETEDTGAVYTGGRDWISSRGTVIRHNYFHDILGYGKDHTGKWVSPHFAWGVYLDDNAGGVDVVGNVIAGCPRAAVHLHNGRDNLIENNVLYDSGLQQVEYSGWTTKHRFWQEHLPTMIKGYEGVFGQPAWKAMRNMTVHPNDAVLPDGKIMANNTVRRNIIAWTNPKASLYHLGAVSLPHNAFDTNLVSPPADKIQITGVQKQPIDFPAWQSLGMDKASIVADPLFADAPNGDFHLLPNSPAATINFHPIPLKRIGPYQDENRATWPIVEAEGAREKPLSP